MEILELKEELLTAKSKLVFIDTTKRLSVLNRKKISKLVTAIDDFLGAKK